MSPYQRTPISNRIPILPPSHSSFWWNQQRRLPETNLPLRLKAKRKHVFGLSTTIVQGLMLGYVEQVWASVQVILVSDSKNLSPWPEETVIDPQETVCKCVLKMTSTSQWMTEMSKCCPALQMPMCSSKISAKHTLWHSVENFLCSTQEKEPPPVGTLLPHSSCRVASTPRLAQSCLSFFPATIPKYDETATSSTALTRMCETSTTSCSALNWLHLCKQAAHKRKHYLLQCFPDSGSTHN